MGCCSSPNAATFLSLLPAMFHKNVASDPVTPPCMSGLLRRQDTWIGAKSLGISWAFHPW